MEELSAPNEKLLRSPYFWEKYGKTTKWLALSIIILLIFYITSRLFLQPQKSTIVPMQPTPTPISAIPTATPVSPNSTANWQTYRSEKYGFEVKYPEDTIIKERDFSKDNLISFSVDFGKISNNQLVMISITNEDMIGFIEEEIVVISRKEIIVGGIKGSLIVGQDQKDGGAIKSIVLLTKNQKLYQITQKIYQSTGSGKIFDQILSTFKFTEKNENIVSDLKKLITQYKIDSKTGARVEIISPDIMERNKKNEVKITISDWDKYGLNLYQSFLSIMNIVDYRLGDKVYSSCKEFSGQEECIVPITPYCNWPEKIILSPLVRVDIFQENKPAIDHILDFPKIEAKISTPTIEICDNGVDDDCNGKIDGLDSNCSAFTITVLPSEGITNLARRAISQYLEKYYSEEYLNKEQKIYAEDYIKRDLKKKISVLKAGEKIEFSVGLLDEAGMEAKKLSFVQISYLNKYTGKINYSAYRFVSKSDLVKDADSVWKIDNDTKNKLMEIYRFKNDGSESWKITEGNGSVIVYYENKAISKILYLIGAYRENITAQDYDFIESLLRHSVELSEDGINWHQAKVVYYNLYDKNNTSASGDGSGTGSFYIDVKDYNNGRLFVKFNLTSDTSGTGITLTKNLKTNLDN